MKKRFITYILLFSFLNFVGCYSSKYVSIDEFEKITKEKDNPEKIAVNTVETGTYQFRRDTYQIKNDTLISTSLLLSYDGEAPFERKFSFDQIQSIEYDQFDVGKTIAAVLGGAALVALTVVAANQMKDMFKWEIKLPSDLFNFNSSGPSYP